MKYIAALTLFFFYAINATKLSANSIHNYNLEGDGCIRHFYTNGSIGCRLETHESSSFPFYVFSDLSIEHQQHFLALQHKFIIILPYQRLNTSILTLLEPQINGVILYMTPNETTPEFNGNAKNRIEKSYFFPMILLNLTSDARDQSTKPKKQIMAEISENRMKSMEITKFYTLLNEIKSKQLNYASAIAPHYRGKMGAYFGPKAMNASTCLTFKDIYGDISPKCDPLGGQSIWSIFGSTETLKLKEKPIIMIVTNMDAKGFSHQYVPGANTAISGVVTMLSLMDTLKKVINPNEMAYRLIFAFFQGEQYGLIGSQRFLYDLMKKSCKVKLMNLTNEANLFSTTGCLDPLQPSLEYTLINPSEIQYVIGIEQTGIGKEIYFHMNPYSNNLTNMTQNIPKDAAKIIMDQDLPPSSSVASFLEEISMNLTAMVVTTYETEFPNVYNSPIDTVKNLNQSLISKVSKTIAVTLLQFLSPQSPTNQTLSVNETFIAELVDCLGSDWSCKLFQYYSLPFMKSIQKQFGISPLIQHQSKDLESFYVGTYQGSRQPVIYDKHLSESYTKLKNQTKWQNHTTSFYLYPNLYEIFLRSYMASLNGELQLQLQHEKTTLKKCEINQDCLSNDYECVTPGICTLRSSFFHNAYSFGIEPDEMPTQFSIINSSANLYTETRWLANPDLLQISIQPGYLIQWICLFLGFCCFLLSFMICQKFVKQFEKTKVL